jgi:hypothetical protein
MPGRVLRQLAYASGLWRIPQVVIDAPDYNAMSSGVRCLHLLCDRLNRLGVSSAVTARVTSRGATSPGIDAPRVHRQTLAAFPALLDRSIVIYPEIIAGNPLRARNVVRYLLNKPGRFTGAGIESYGAHDYVIHFADEFKPPELASRLLRLPLVDTAVFTPPPPATVRNGFLVYSVRHRPDVAAFPEWIDPITMIAPETPRDPATLARLYQTSRALIVGERTAATSEARHCHCPVLIIPHADFAFEPVMSFSGGAGLAIGLDEAGLAQASDSVASFPAAYAAQFTDLDTHIRDIVADAAHHFGLQPLNA